MVGHLSRKIGVCLVAVSRDGEHFTRVNPHQALVRRGERSQWDAAHITVARAVEFQDEVNIFYSATNENWGSWPPDNSPFEQVGRAMAGWSYPAQSGLAVLRRDGFTHLRARDGFGPGTATTIPIRVTNPENAVLQVNISNLMVYRDWVEVEVLEAETGEPIPDYSRTDCLDLVADGTEAPVFWRAGRSTLAGVNVSEIKLRFYLHGAARLHSFTFQR